MAGKPAFSDTELLAPCRLEYYEPKFELSKADSFYPQFSAEWILYSDPDLGVAFKPAGLPTTAARDQQQFHLSRYLSRFLDSPIHMPSRLDTAVSGLLLFSRSQRANRWCQKAFEKHLLEKLYVCEVSGRPQFSDSEISHSLGRDERHPVLRRVVSPGGEDARTRLSTLACFETDSSQRALVQAQPLTGRTHQIRVHCAAEGYPIVGDPLYGGLEAASLKLTSLALRFRHPFLNRQEFFELPLALYPSWLQDITKAGMTVRLRIP